MGVVLKYYTGIIFRPQHTLFLVGFTSYLIYQGVFLIFNR